MCAAVIWHDLESRLRTHVAALAGTPRPPLSEAHLFTRRYIQKELASAGFQCDEHLIAGAGEPCFNILTRPIPNRSDLPLLIVGAHYDSIPTSAGADDNASAVAALLEAARWLYPQLKSAKVWATARLQLAAYDLEEYGMIGSLGHVSRIDAPVRCMISLEMLGYTDKRPGGQKLPPNLAHLYPNVGDFIGIVGNEASSRWLRIATDGMKTVKGLKVESMAVPGNGEALPPVRLSDHISFWDNGMHALMFTDTSFFRNPHYHMATDTPDTLDYDFLAKVTQGVGAAIMRLLAVE
jgi:Zn-dependent M28 family amino/carboxypeptidase